VTYGPLFNYQRPLGNVLLERQERLKQEVRGERQSYVRDVDADEWAEHLADKYSIEPPVLLMDQQCVEDLGEREVDATGMPGVTFSTSEWGRRIMRTGRELRLVIPVEGDAELLIYGPAAGAPMVEAAIEGDSVYRRWDWPLDRGPEQLDQEIRATAGALEAGGQRIATQVEEYNAGLKNFALAVITERRRELERHSDFLSGISMPVARAEDAPGPINRPPIERRQRPNPLVPKPEPVSGPALGQLYDEILDVIRPTGRAMERTPEDFATRDAERLRDNLLVALNTQYRGLAVGEAFNHRGKTDILLRVQDENAFIGECKWWSGPSGFEGALAQLLGYSTWRDSRLALIIFVGTKDPNAVVEKAKAALGQAAEFDGWNPVEHDRELRCRIKWPDDPGRTAILSVLFFHLPNAA
jgi:hypothetical protein